jgi:hypothetical protein
VRFVLGNRFLDRAGGTEVHLLTLAEQLRRLGHEPVLHSPVLGPFTEHVRSRGFTVAERIDALPDTCDVVFVQDQVVVHDLAARYPDTPLVFRVCGDVFDFQFPPQVDGLVDLVVALSDRYERLARACAVAAPVARLRVPIDTDRLVPFGPLRGRPVKAVLLGNYGERDAVVRAAWEPAGVEVARVGGDVQSFDVARSVSDADVVVAKGRAALDAMACGKAVYVLDFLGGDGWVTPERYPALEADNFAGQATSEVAGVESVRAALDAYRPEMGVANRDLVLQHHGARDHAVALLEAIGSRAVGRSPGDGAAPGAAAELSRLVALGWGWEQVARELREHYWPLHAHAARVEGRLQELLDWGHRHEADAREARDRVTELERELRARPHA